MVNGGGCTELPGLALERNGAAGHSWEALGYINVVAQEKGVQFTLRSNLVRRERGHQESRPPTHPAAVYYPVLLPMYSM